MPRKSNKSDAKGKSCGKSSVSKRFTFRTKKMMALVTILVMVATILIMIAQPQTFSPIDLLTLLVELIGLTCILLYEA